MMYLAPALTRNPPTETCRVGNGQGLGSLDSSKGRDATNQRSGRPSTFPVRSPGSSRATWERAVSWRIILDKTAGLIPAAMTFPGGVVWAVSGFFGGFGGFFLIQFGGRDSAPLFETLRKPGIRRRPVEPCAPAGWCWVGGEDRIAWRDDIVVDLA